MTIRALVFPDHTADDFDPNVVVTHNDIDYKWNGSYGWEVVCKGGGSVEEYDDEWIKDDQQRQDKELADYKNEVTLDQERQDKELSDYKDEVTLDQQRQDEAIQELQDKVNTPCGTSPVTGTLQRSTAEPLYWYEAGTADGSKWYLTVTQALHQGEWPWPKLEDTPNIWVNDTKYDVLSVSNTGGIDWKYQLPANSLDHLVGQEVTVSLCSNDPPWVTHEQLEQDQERQDEEWAKDQKRQDDALEAEINARAERDLTHDAQLNTLEYKLNQLVGLTFKGTYEFKHEADCDAVYDQCVADCWNNDPNDHECRTECGRDHAECEADKVRAGFFEAVDPDDQFDHLEQIIISKSDVDGVELDWSGYLDPGDYLEVDHSLKGELDKRNYGLYRITEEPEHTQNSIGEDVYVIKLQFLQGDGVLAEGEVYEIRGITSAEGVNPEELGDFLTKEEAGNTYALKTHTHDDRYHKKNTNNGGNYFVTANHQEILKSNYHAKDSSTNILLSNHTTIAQSTFATAHSHPYASSSHNHNSDYVKGNYTISRDTNGNYYIA